MQRKKMRKFDAIARRVGLGRPENRDEMEDSLSTCSNGRTRARLRARFQRAAR